MEFILGVIGFVSSNFEAILGAVLALLAAGIAIALLIPGPEPEATFRRIAAILEKISRK